MRCSQGKGYPIVDEFGDRMCGCAICRSSCDFCCLMPNLPEISAYYRMQEMEEKKRKEGSGSLGNDFLAELHRAATDQVSMLVCMFVYESGVSNTPSDEFT